MYINVLNIPGAALSNATLGAYLRSPPLTKPFVRSQPGTTSLSSRLAKESSVSEPLRRSPSSVNAGSDTANGKGNDAGSKFLQTMNASGCQRYTYKHAPPLPLRLLRGLRTHTPPRRPLLSDPVEKNGRSCEVSSAAWGSSGERKILNKSVACGASNGSERVSPWR